MQPDQNARYAPILTAYARYQNACISNKNKVINPLKYYRCAKIITVERVVPGNGSHPFSILVVDGFNPFQRLGIADPAQIYLSGR